MKRILIIDDDEDLLVALRDYFKRLGVEVQASASCKEGWQMLEHFLPDIVITDVNVGSEDGRELCKMIKAQAHLLHIPVVLISADEEALKLYQAYGADCCLNKPFRLALLADMVNACF